jgi:hypothetical protein
MTDASNDDCGVEIALMLDRGDNFFDESRFQLILSIYDRAMKQRSTVAIILIEKIHKLIASYKTDLMIAAEKTNVLSRRINMSFPESSTDVDQLEQHYNVSMLTKLEDRLIRSSGESTLSTLTNLLIEEAECDENQGLVSFLELLQSQEDDVFKTYTGNKANVGLQRRELKATRLFRKSQETLNSEKLVKQAIKEGPDNPGPINPHMLAIRSLSTMQSLSPAYLKRFLSYIDTVFWLDQVSEELKLKTKNKRLAKLHEKS